VTEPAKENLETPARTSREFSQTLTIPTGSSSTVTEHQPRRRLPRRLFCLDGAGLGVPREPLARLTHHALEELSLVLDVAFQRNVLGEERIVVTEQVPDEPMVRVPVRPSGREIEVDLRRPGYAEGSPVVLPMRFVRGG
jgi:hypothetical protein